MRIKKKELRKEMDKKERAGTIQTLLAYVMWGFLTLFWNLLSEVNSVYILTQRIVWSMLFMCVVILFAGRGKEIGAVLKNPGQLGICLVSGILVSVNWGVYIYAINSGHVLDASLGYFIEPLLVAVIGVLVFKEKLNRYEKLTYACSIAGLLYLIVTTRTFPVLSVVIAGSFAVYGAVKEGADPRSDGVPFRRDIVCDTDCPYLCGVGRYGRKWKRRCVIRLAVSAASGMWSDYLHTASFV